MMKKLSIITSTICILLMILSPMVFAEEVLSFTDETRDVSDATGKQVNRPNIDIYILSCSQENIVVELKLQLASGGTIQNSELIFYEMILETNKTLYTVDYASGEALIADEEGNEIDVIEYSGVGTNELKISFNLSSPDEECLNLSATSFEFSLSEEGYFDEYPNQVEIFEVDAGGPYTGTVGKPIQFYGNSDYESPDLEWAWDFGDGETSELRNPKHTYAENGTYDVTLIVSDPEGIKMGYDETTIEVTASGTPNGDENGGSKDSGFGLIIFIVLIVIVVVGGIAAVIFIRRR